MNDFKYEEKRNARNLLAHQTGCGTLEQNQTFCKCNFRYLFWNQSIHILIAIHRKFTCNYYFIQGQANIWPIIKTISGVIWHHYVISAFTISIAAWWFALLLTKQSWMYHSSKSVANHPTPEHVIMMALVFSIYRAITNTLHIYFYL